MEEKSEKLIETDTDAKVMDMGVAESDSGRSEIANNEARSLSMQNPNESKEEHSFGKFKTADELLKAYKSLEAEFTKRSQKLAKYENDKEKSKSWEEKVDNFFERNPIASSYVDKIMDELVLDGELKESEECLDIAFNRALNKLLKPYDRLVKDREFLDKYVVNNDEIKEEIIATYLSNVAKSHPYNLIDEGGKFTLSPKNRPKTIRECGDYIEKTFN